MSASDWIKIRVNLPADPAVDHIATATRLHPARVVGSLVAIWTWADALTADGFVRLAGPSRIDTIAGKKGFAEAMQAAGWLTIETDGIRFPGWGRHNGQSAKARAGEAERKRQQRLAGQTSGKDRTPRAEMSGQMSGQNPDEVPDQRRGEERREEGVGAETFAAGKPQPTPKPPELSDEDWLQSLSDAEEYGHINVPIEHAKMVRWCSMNRKQPTRRRFVAWLNRIEAPMRPASANGSTIPYRSAV